MNGERTPHAGVTGETHDPLAGAFAEFRGWYEQAAAGADGPPPEPPPALDVHTLMGHYLALRQEVNLQTRAVRAQQEQSAETVRQLTQSLEMLTRTQARNEQMERQSQDERLKPLLTTLIELHDALGVANREIARTQTGLEDVLAGLVPEQPGPPAAPPPPPAPADQRRPFWSRWTLSPSAEAQLRASQEETHAALVRLHEERAALHEKAERAAASADRVRQTVQALLTGYTMSLERVERALRRHGLEAIPAVGQAFDPERMEAVDRVANSGRPGGEVVEEVRRGYLHNGRVFRYAQVRVARD